MARSNKNLNRLLKRTPITIKCVIVEDGEGVFDVYSENGLQTWAYLWKDAFTSMESELIANAVDPGLYRTKKNIQPLWEDPKNYPVIVPLRQILKQHLKDQQ